MRPATTTPIRDRKEQGIALLVSVIMLSLLGMVALAALDTTMRDRQVAGYQSRSRTALYAAEAGIAQATGVIRAGTQALAGGGEAALLGWNPAFATQGSPQILGSSSYPPSFYADPDATQPIRYLEAAEPCWNGSPQGAMGINIGSVQWRQALWDVRVSGATTDGALSDIEAIVTSCHPYNG